MAKNYIKGNAKLITTQFGDIINLNLNLEDLKRLKEYKGYVRLTIAPRKEVGKYGETHTIYENEYHKEKSEQTTDDLDSTNKYDGEGLPF